MPKRRSWTDKDLINAWKDSNSLAQAIRKIGLVARGGNYKSIKRHAKRLGLDIEALKNKPGKGMSKGHYNSRFPTQDILDGKHPQYSSSKLRKRLIEEGYKKHQCEMCLREKWLDDPIPLELDHIDGNNSNHKLDNLRVICPNCHSKTDTYRGRNIKL